MDRLEEVVARLDRLRFASDLTIHRSGTWLAAAVQPATRERDASYATRIWRFDLGGNAAMLTDGPGADTLPRHSPVDDRLVFASDRMLKGKMSPFILEGGEARPLGDVPGTVEDMRWTADGRALLVLAADRGLDGGATNGAVRIWWGEPEDPAVTEPRTARRRLYRITITDGATVEVGPRDHSVWEFDPLGDGGAVALISSDASERGWYHSELARIDFAGRSTEILHRSYWQLQGPVVDPSGRRVAFIEGWASDRGVLAGEIRVLDLADGAVASLAAQEISNVSSVDWRDVESLWFTGWSRLGSAHGVVGLEGRIAWMEREDTIVGTNSFVAQVTPLPDKSAVVAVREAVGAPPEIFLRRGREADWQPVSRINTEVADDFPHYPEVRPVTWKGAGGLDMEGFLLLPRDRPAGPSPMVVDIHGGPTWSVKHSFNPGFALPLAAAGYAVFLPNYRGNLGWGQEFARLNIGDPGGAEFEDILAGIDWCIAEGFANPDRLGVTGASYGGYMTAWAVATTHRFRAAVMVSGISNQWSSHYSCNHDFGEFIVGGPLSDDRFRQIAIDRSPLFRLAGATTPTLIIHGSEDRCTPLGQAQEFHAALIEQDVPSELVVYPREGHGLRERGHRRDAWRRTVGWFDRYLRTDL